MVKINNNTVIILLSCKDKKGIVFKITNFIFNIGGNIINLDEHVDIAESKFFLRVEFELVSQNEDYTNLSNDFGELAAEFNANWSIHKKGRKRNLAIFVSKYDHCLQDILWRYSQNEFEVDIKMIISNHSTLKNLAEHHNIPFFYFNIHKENKKEVEIEQIKLLEKFDIETIILARYMQILSPKFVRKYKNEIINIHHSFLPAFVGGNPYKQAFQRGVKIIGATCHFVTSELDEGPIIEQDIIRISHNDSLKDLIRKGKDLERTVLAKGILYHSQHRILVDGKKTIVFN